MAKTIQDLSDEVEKEFEYFIKRLKALTKKGVSGVITKEKGIITHIKMESVK